jgi:hypothetical protein
MAAGQLGVVDDLLEHVPMDVEIAADGAPAMALDEDATRDLGPVFHVDVHSVIGRYRDLDGVSEPLIVVPTL